jgi:haloalkane dehalogenase
MNFNMYYCFAFCFLLSLSVLVIITGGVLLSVLQTTNTYNVFGTEASNMSRSNQTLQHNISLSYEQNISAEFPFESNYVDVLGSKMHYIDEGEGDPILFIHGNPTSSYLWRNIIPYMEPYGRAIAVDLIGMGKSDKPDIDYRFVDHAKYLDGFIEKLGLKNITLVVHDWGSALGFNYAMQHEENVKGIAFMEAFLMPLTWNGFPNIVKETFQNIRTPEIGYDLVVNKNIFVEQLLPGAILRNLAEEEMNNYREPYEMAESRIPVWVWPNEIPIDGNPADVHNIVTDYSQWLQETELPKLLFYASPGGLINASIVDWSKANLKNLETVDLGQGLHYLQEDHPHAIGKTLSNWIQQQKSKS